MSNNTIDLRDCKPGQPLRSKHGIILTYVKPLDASCGYDHEVRYPDGSMGTRTHDGHVYRNPEKRLDADHDIVEILPMPVTFTVTMKSVNRDGTVNESPIITFDLANKTNAREHIGRAVKNMLRKNINGSIITTRNDGKVVNVVTVGPSDFV